MKFIHIADIHASKDRKNQTLKILQRLQDFVSANSDIDFIAIAGDFWDTTVTNTKSSGFSDIVDAMNVLNKLCPVRMIYGTAGHEANGSLDVFKILGIEVHSEIEFSEKDKILWIPEPRKSLFIKETQEETNVAIKQYLEKISKYTDVNAVVVHGEIEGAFYDNGSACNSPISIPRSLLKHTNAKYIAAGHIHTPQVIKDINCYYVGSSAPLNFGETHDGHFNVVTINETATVEEISFGFPQNVTIEIPLSDIPAICKNDFTNKNIKIKLLCDSKVNKKAIEKEITEKTHCTSCKVNPEYKNNISIRSKEILTQKSITDKLKTYAAVNGIKLSQHALKIAHNLEENMLIKYRFPSHSFRLLYASIKGAIGIEKPEVNLDFSKYSPGVIVMTGHNGAGKTTILENLHPYPCMLTRSGKLRDHFSAHDSHRILVYEDETGKKYRITMQIIADIKNGSVKYYVETDSGNGWQPVPECDGNLDSYNKYIEETFGSLPLFMRTSFFTDKETNSCPDISKTTKSERMDLFSKLAGTDHFATLCQITKDSAKDISSQIKNLSLAIGSKPDCLKLKDTLLESRSKTEESIEENIKILQTKKEIFSKLRRKDIEYQKYLAKEEASRLLVEQYKKEIEENNLLLEKIKEDKALTVSLAEHEHDIRLFNDFSEKSQSLKNDLLNFQTKLSPVDKKLNELALQIAEKENKVSKIDSEIKIIQNDLIHEEEHIHLDSTEICPVCGAKLSIEKQEELNENLRETKKIIENLKKEISLKVLEKESFLSEIEDIKKDVEKEETKKSALADEFKVLKEDLERCISSLQKFYDNKIDILANSKPLFSDHDKKIVQVETKISELNSEIRKQTPKNVPQDVSEQLKAAEKEVEEYLENDKVLSNELQKINLNIETADKNLKEIEEAEKNISSLNKDLEDYEVLTKAFSNSGIQALELEATIPKVIEIANDILHNSYGDNFTINFSSTHQGSTKLIEDFNITVFNAAKNREVTLDYVSAGELVWIKQALYYAFSVSRQNNTGFSFLTRFMDESDGHLDSAIRVKYMQMINAAHIAGNASQTILITHSQEIKDVAEQVIEL